MQFSYPNRRVLHNTCCEDRKRVSMKCVTIRHIKSNVGLYYLFFS